MMAVFDLDAVDAETTGVAYEFLSHGVVYSLSAGSDCDWRVLTALSKDDLSGAIRLLLGDEQYETFVRHPVSAKGLSALLKSWSSFKGDQSGESSASPAS